VVVETLQFPNNAQGQAAKNEALAAYLTLGWTVVSETVTPGKFNGGTACCNFLICAPTAFLAGTSDGTINLTIQNSGRPEDVRRPNVKWKTGGGRSSRLGGLIVFFIFLWIVVALSSHDKQSTQPSSTASSAPVVKSRKKKSALATDRKGIEKSIRGKDYNACTDFCYNNYSGQKEPEETCYSICKDRYPGN
jgi:hypothetical protein